MVLRSITFFLLSVLGLMVAVAQEVAADNKIHLSVITPENIDDLDESQLSRINSKFSDILTSAGFSGEGSLSSSFVVYPKILVNEMRESDLGMYRVFSASMDVTIKVLHLSTKTVYQSMTFELRGNGESRRTAIDNAIRSMKTSSDELNHFFSSAKAKIVRFYSENCNELIKKGELQLSQKNYEEAFLIFFSIPPEVDCFQQIRPVISNAFKLYQSQRCMEILQSAKAKYGSRDFVGALSYLSKIDPESKCSAESNKLINDCFRNITADEAKKFQFLKDSYKTEKILEGKRIDAARDIAVEYYRSRPVKISYNAIVVL